MTSRLEALCMEKGLKMTGQRRVISQVLSEADDHPDVEEVHRRAVQIDPRISIATVYRTMRLLVDAQVIERVDLIGGPELRFRRDADALRVALPAPQVGTFAPALRIRGRGLV